jgi:hypothetical protein
MGALPIPSRPAVRSPRFRHFVVPQEVQQGNCVRSAADYHNLHRQARRYRRDSMTTGAA